MKLFLLAHACGNVWDYFRIFQDMSDLELIPIELPGDLSNIGEALPATMEEYIQAAKQKLNSELVAGEPFLLWGHSFGGYIVFELARMMHKRPPHHIFISGCTPPHKECNKYEHGKNYIQLYGFLKGCAEEYVDEISRIYNPILGSKLNVLDKYREKYLESGIKPVLNCSCTVIGSDDDSICGQFQEWEDYFQPRNVQIYILKGDHFYWKEKSNQTILTKLISNVVCS